MSIPRGKVDARSQRSPSSTGAGGAERSRRVDSEASQFDRLASTTRAGASALLLISLFVYLPCLRCGFIWDDDAHVTANAALRTAQGLRDIWLQAGATPQYYPLVFTTFWVEYHLWGLWPAGYHLVNVVLHGCSVVLLWRCLSRLAIPGAWLAAAIFAVHPVHVESVAWVTERKNVLSGFFYLSAMLAYLRFCRIERQETTPPIAWGWYFPALVLFMAALLSKTVTCSLPAVILLLLWWKRDRLSVRDLWPLVPLLAIGAVMGLRTAWIEKHEIGAAGAEWTLTIIDRLLIAGRALWFYAAKLVFPWPLSFIYPRWEIDSGVWWQFLFPVAVLLLLVVLWLVRSRIDRGIWVAVLFFAGTLFPALGFIDIYPMRYSFVADHFQYLASIGLITLMTAWWVQMRVWPVARTLASGAILLALVLLTWHQQRFYADAETLWRAVLARNPSAWIAHSSLGLAAEKRGATNEAVTHYQAALRANPNAPEAHANLASLLAGQGRVDEAIDHARKALQRKPTLAGAHNALGMALTAKGDYPAARHHLEEALRLYAGSAEFHNNLASVLVEQKQLEEALMHLRQAVRLKGDALLPRQNLALVLAKLGRYGEAADELRGLIRMAPQQVDARINLAVSLVHLGRVDEAVNVYQETLRLDPQNRLAQMGLARLVGASTRAGG